MFYRGDFAGINLAEQAQAIAFKDNLSERGGLELCYQGLVDTVTDFTSMESAWVICRLAVLMGWESLEYGRDGHSQSGTL